MAYDSVSGINIAGICCCVPDDCRKIADINGKTDAELEQFIKTTGIEQAYRSDILHTTTSDLCLAAATRLFEESQIERNSINAIILVTQSPDYIQPATACVLQYRLGLSNDCIAYDVNLGCSGYVYGLHLAALYLQRNNINKVLLLAGESCATQKGMVIEDEPKLWGDAGSATVLEKSDNNDPFEFLLKTDGSGFRHLNIRYGGFRHGFEDDISYHMSGADVFAFTLREIPKAFKDFYSYYNSSQDDYDVFILHQANRMIVENIARKLKVPMSKVPISLDLYGNTSSTSIPLGICDYFNRHCTDINNETKMIVSGYGVGLSWGVASFNINGNVCLPVISTKSNWDDGIDYQ